jgi:hypothetical protein
MGKGSSQPSQRISYLLLKRSDRHTMDAALTVAIVCSSAGACPEVVEEFIE